MFTAETVFSYTYNIVAVHRSYFMRKSKVYNFVDIFSSLEPPRVKVALFYLHKKIHNFLFVQFYQNINYLWWQFKVSQNVFVK